MIYKVLTILNSLFILLCIVGLIMDFKDDKTKKREEIDFPLWFEEEPDAKKKTQKKEVAKKTVNRKARSTVKKTGVRKG